MMDARLAAGRCFARSRTGLTALAGLSLILLAALPAGASLRQWVHRPSRAEAPSHAPLGTAVARASVADPTGDTLGTVAPQFDITRLSAEVQGADLVIGLTFATPITAPDSGQANALDGFIDLDTDQDGSTGTQPWTDFLTGGDTTGMGDELYVDLFSYRTSDGLVDVVLDEPGNPSVAGRVPMEVAPQRVTLRIPLAVLGDDGLVDVAAVTVVGEEEATDIVPNQGSLASTIAQGGGGTLVDTGDTSPCDAGATKLCLNGDRFEVSTEWATQQGTSGSGQAVPLTPDTGYFWFFSDSNVELVVKVLDACSGTAGPPRFWVFAGGLTNVEVTLTVRDTESGLARIYENMQSTPFQPIQDTGAFATCP